MKGQFKVKRGMVFYLDEPVKTQPIKNDHVTMPRKLRPYIVISNDGCNEFSSNIHVAPIFTRTPSDKPYHVTFSSSDGRESCIDVGQIMLIQKALCNVSNYSEAITRSAKAALSQLQDAIRIQFSCEYERQVNDEKTDSDENKEAPPISNIPVTQYPPINLVINLSGIPVSGNSISVSSTANVETTITDETETETDTETNSDSKEAELKVFSEHKKGRLTLKRRSELKEEIIKMYRMFNGNMTVKEISAKLGIADATVSRLINEIADTKSGRGCSTGKFSKLKGKVLIQFMSDFDKLARDEMLKKYKKYGFKTKRQLYDKYAYEKKHSNN